MYGQILTLLYSGSAHTILTLLALNFLLVIFFTHVNYSLNISSSYREWALFFIKISTLVIFLLLAFILYFEFYYVDIILNTFAQQHLSSIPNITFFRVRFISLSINRLGWGVLLLCFISTILCLWYLGEFNLFLKKGSSSYFLFFLLCTFVMVRSTNLLIVFLCFELIFYPSLYFVYTLGYAKKTDKTIFFLLAWTLFGSFLVLLGLGYIYAIHGTLDISLLLCKQFSTSEKWYLFFTFFIGFGIKLPIFPFHYWLTKVHVEAPAGFSMFLSGFLVKTAVYCFYVFSLPFTSPEAQKLTLLWLGFCVLESSIKMWTQVDIKKLIAFATIQEMNLILLLLIPVGLTNIGTVVIFILMHGLLSIYMFFLVDKLQQIAQSRNLLSLMGLGQQVPFFKGYTWVMLIFFLGIPLTVKFLIEFMIGALILTHFGILGCVIFSLCIVFGGVGFVRCWLLILYGNPSPELTTLPTVGFTWKDKIFMGVIIFCLLILSLFIFIF